MPLHFSGLETTLIALVAAFVACVGLFVTLGSRYMTRKECLLQHKSSQSSDDALKDQIADLAASLNQLTDKLSKKQDLQFRMIRELIVHSDLPKEEKAKILNMSEAK